MTVQTTKPELVGMTQAKWDAMTPAERDALRDTSQLHPALRGLEGKRVRVERRKWSNRRTFRVGISTGWQPIHLAMRGNASGSSDVIVRTDDLGTVEVLP